MGADTVKIFCPKCKCVYHPPLIRSRSNHGPVNHSSGNGAIDGAAFGTTFPHLFLMTFNNLVPDALSPETSYTPRVFGFRVHHIARPRNGGGTDGAARTTTSGINRSRYAVTPVDATAVANGAGRAQNAGEMDGTNAAVGAAVATHPQDQDVQDDKTASLQAAASLQPGKVDAEATGPADGKGRGSGVDGKILKTDDSVGAAKRKSKVGDGSKINPGDTENGTAARNKRQKRQLGVSS